MTGADLIALIKKQPIAFACGLIVVLCAGWIYYDSDGVDNAQRDFEEKEKESKKIAANARSANGLAEQTAELQSAMKHVESHLLRVADLANNLQIFYRLETETGVKLVDARQNTLPTPKQGAPKTLYTAIPFSISIQGNYTQLWSFIRRVETIPQFGRFTRLTLTKVEGGGNEVAADTMTAVLTLELLGTP